MLPELSGFVVAAGASLVAELVRAGSAGVGQWLLGNVILPNLPKNSLDSGCWSHEGVGNVALVGPGVTHLSEGDRVGVVWLYTACGHCTHCWSGWETLCEAQKNTGYSVSGAFAEYVVADPNCFGHLPSNVDFVQIAPILCAGITVYKCLKVLGSSALPPRGKTKRNFP
jgi:hypothetical protein